MKEKISKTWKLIPRSVRKTIVLVTGFTLILLGSLLVVLPGPFTLPLIFWGWQFWRWSLLGRSAPLIA